MSEWDGRRTSAIGATGAGGMSGQLRGRLGPRVLIVCRSDPKRAARGDAKASYINEQVAALRASGVDASFAFVVSGGPWGYLAAVFEVRRQLRNLKVDLIHAHYALSGLVARCQWSAPLIVTFHGSDINRRDIRPIARLLVALADWRIFVSDHLAVLAGLSRNDARVSVIPCGVDLTVFRTLDRTVARKALSLSPDASYVLFAGAFDDPVKNYPLAQAGLSQVPGVQVIELKGYSRADVALLLNAVDLLLLTSASEGSPQIIKEAMACSCPIVSVNVGDVETMIREVAGCYLVESTPDSVGSGIQAALAFSGRTNGRALIQHLDGAVIASELKEVYAHLARR